MARSKKVKAIQSKRAKGRYKKIGKFFLYLGSFCIIISGILYPLYVFGVIFKEPPYTSPIPFGGSIASGSDVFNPLQALKSSLQKSGVRYKSITYTGGEYVTILSTGQEVDFAANKNIVDQIASLQLITTRLTIEGKRFSRLDFRYDKPVMEVENTR